MTLIDVYDGAFLHPMSQVPSSVKAICGYVGGPDAYHVWSVSDAQTVRDSGREFWSIWVPLQHALSAADGHTAAQGMIATLPRYSHPKHCPVILNIEYDTWAASRLGAAAAADAFEADMHAAGYPRAFAYVPLAAGYGWGSKYTYTRPDNLPAGILGIQYEDDKRAHSGWDASVFDAALLGQIDPPPKQPTQETDMPLNNEDKASIDHIVSSHNAAMENKVQQMITAAVTELEHDLDASLEARISAHNSSLESRLNASIADAVAKAAGAK